ncbi:MAG: ECF-type sigma factor, partial [Planctomycetota bacterium]
MNTEPSFISRTDSSSPIWGELYDQLRDIAARQMRRESNGSLLQTTAIVHEAFLRMKNHPAADDRNHFLAAASVTMRRVLIDEARKRKSIKRGANQNCISLNESSL